MENKLNPDSPEGNPEGWNSEKAMVGPISCAEAARFLTAYMAAFRAVTLAEIEGDKKSAARQALRLVIGSLDVLESGALTGKELEYAESQIGFMMATIGQAMVATSGWANQPICAQLAEESLDALMRLIEKVGIESVNDSHISFFVQKVNPDNPKDGNIKVGLKLSPVGEVLDKIEGHPVKQAIITLARQKGPNDSSKN